MKRKDIKHEKFWQPDVIDNLLERFFNTNVDKRKAPTSLLDNMFKGEDPRRKKENKEAFIQSLGDGDGDGETE